MGKVNINITFDKDFLSKVVNDQNSCVQVCKKTYHLALHPFHLTNLNSSIKEILSEKIAKYDKTFDGILLGYQNVKLLGSEGAINFDSCFIHANVEADFYIFKPAVGQILNGVVNKKSKDHVGCLVHKTFNISLPKPENCEEWIGYSAQIGQEIQFEIIFTDLEGKLPYIKGKVLSLPSDDSGFSTSEEPNCQQNTIIQFNDSDTEVPHGSVEKKKRKRESNSSFSDTETKKKVKHDYCNDIEKYEKKISKSHKKHKHKNKKDKDIDENVILQNSFDNDNEENLDKSFDVKIKKSHKHRKRGNVGEAYDSPNIETNTGAKESCQQNFPVSLEMEISADNNSSGRIATKKKKKKDKYSQEANEFENSTNNLDTEEHFEKRHKKTKHKHEKDSEAKIFKNSIESEVSINHEKKRRYSEEVLNDTELKTHVKKKKKRKCHE